MAKHTQEPEIRQSPSQEQSVESCSSVYVNRSARPALPVGSGDDGAAGGATPISCPPELANFGIDTIHATFDIAFHSGKLFARMKEAKESLQLGNDKEAAFQFLESGSDIFTWNLQRSGMKFFPFVFRTGDITLALAPHRPLGSTIPNMEVKLGSLTCQQDVLATMKMLQIWLKKVGIRIHEEKVSRLDLCADLRHDIRQGGIDQISQYITRVTKQTPFYTHRKFTGIMHGKGDICCRIYDKQLEMEEQGSLEKAMFFNGLWNTKPNEPITRVEFQLRREAIKDFFKGKTTIEVMVNRSSDLWQYLTCSWMRHSSEEVDRENNHQSRAVISEFWQSVQKAGSAIKRLLSRKRNQKHINVPALIRQATGILTTVCAGLGHKADCFFELVGTCQQIISDDLSSFMADPNFSRRYRTKQVAAVVTF